MGASAVAEPLREATPAGARPRLPTRWWIPAIGLAIVALDQLTKWWALERLGQGPIDLVGPLRLRLTFNTGGAFGLGAGFAPILAVGAFVLVVVLARMGHIGARPVTSVAVAAILGGAVGNLADRIFREGSGFLGGAVVDFIDLQFWPVFNVADMAIVVGGALLVWGERPAAHDGPASP